MLPQRIQQHLQRLTAEERALAYVLADHAGKLSAYGGQLETYGLLPLQLGLPISDQILLLVGLLPLNGKELHLPCVLTESGRPADLHLLPAAEGDYVLFLDASEQEQRHQAIQQKGY